MITGSVARDVLDLTRWVGRHVCVYDIAPVVVLCKADDICMILIAAAIVFYQHSSGFENSHGCMWGLDGISHPSFITLPCYY